VSVWSKTDPGRRRERNEDSFVADAGLALFAVADGMGGHQGGATASKLALEEISAQIRHARQDMESAFRALRLGVRATQPVRVVGSWLPEEGSDDKMLPVMPIMSVLRAAARRANRNVFETALDNPTLMGMGTTLTAGVLEEDKFHVVHVGDSRCYLFRDTALRQITSDHTWIAEQMRLGIMTEEQAKTSRFRHVITRSVGFEPDVEIESHTLAVEPGDCVLLCSDGLSNYIDGEELQTIMRATWFRELPDRLVALANERGGDDNITVVVGLFSNHQPG
jgi:protein phosphatase